MRLPLIIWIPYRILMAFWSTFRLLIDIRLLRALPWRYIVRLPLRNAWIAIAVVGVVGGLVGLIGLAVAPTSATHELYAIGFSFAFPALVSTWVRAIRQWRSLRHG